MASLGPALGLDFGTRRIGLAISDPEGTFAFPAGAIERTGLRKDPAARAGVGRMLIVDRDFVETSNLQRQVLFDETDAREGLPKAVAAERHLRDINSTIQVEGRIADANPGNIEALILHATVVVDATDNFEPRFLLNDACVKTNTPWIYGGAVGVEGTTSNYLPGRTACLRIVSQHSQPH